MKIRLHQIDFKGLLRRKMGKWLLKNILYFRPNFKTIPIRQKLLICLGIIWKNIFRSHLLNEGFIKHLITAKPFKYLNSRRNTNHKSAPLHSV